MNRKEATLVVKAAKKAGMRVAVAPSFYVKGVFHVMRIYDRAGNSTGFNPYIDLGDAILLATECRLGIYLTSDEFTVFDSRSHDEKKSITISFSGKSKKPKNYRIGNAIVNMANLINTPPESK